MMEIYKYAQQGRALMRPQTESQYQYSYNARIYPRSSSVQLYRDYSHIV